MEVSIMNIGGGGERTYTLSFAHSLRSRWNIIEPLLHGSHRLVYVFGYYIHERLTIQ